MLNFLKINPKIKEITSLQEFLIGLFNETQDIIGSEPFLTILHEISNIIKPGISPYTIRFGANYLK